MEKEKSNVHLHVTISRSLMDNLETEATADERSLAFVVRKALTEYFERRTVAKTSTKGE